MPTQGSFVSSPFKYMRLWYVVVSGAVLLVTGILKVFGAFGPQTQLSGNDPVFGVSNQLMFLAVGIIEVVIAMVCFFNAHSKLAQGLVVWVSFNFLAYRFFISSAGWQLPCGCSGGITVGGLISLENMDQIMRSVALGMFVVGAVLLVPETIWKRYLKAKIAILSFASLFMTLRANASEHVEAFKDFVSGKATFVEMVVEESYPMSTIGTPPKFYRVARQQGAVLVREGDSLDAVIKPISGTSGSAVGYHGTNYWQISQSGAPHITLREFYDDGQNDHSAHQAKRNVESGLMRAGNILSMGLMVPNVSGVNWAGDNYSGEQAGSPLRTTGYVAQASGKVAETHSTIMAPNGQVRRFKAAYLYSESHSGKIPVWCPTSFSLYGVNESDKEGLSHVIRVHSLNISESLADWDFFGPSNHIGAINVRHIKEIASGAVFLDQTGLWTAVSYEVPSEQGTKWPVAISFVTLSLLSAFAIYRIFLRARLKKV